MDQLIATGRVERAALGIQIKRRHAERRRVRRPAGISGVLVSDFDDPSPAKPAGIQPGDIIVSVDGKPVNYTGQLQQAIGFSRPGKWCRSRWPARAGSARRSGQADRPATSPDG